MLGQITIRWQSCSRLWRAEPPAVVLFGSFAILKIRVTSGRLVGPCGMLRLDGTGCLPNAASRDHPWRPRPTVLLTACFPIAGSPHLDVPLSTDLNEGLFTVLRGTWVTLARMLDPSDPDCLLFGAFFEGAAGFGTLLCGHSSAILIHWVRPLTAYGLSLIANPAPVGVWGTGHSVLSLKTYRPAICSICPAMVGTPTAPFSLLIPVWGVWASPVG